MVSTIELFGNIAQQLSLVAQKGGFKGGGGGGGGEEAGAAGLIFVCVYFIIILAVTIPTIAGMWKVFDKAGQPGWAAIVPIYNMYVLNEVAKKEMTWFILYLVAAFVCGPLAIIPLFVINAGVAERFGKGGGFGAGLTLLPFIFYPMLGFGDAKYAGKQKKRYSSYDDDEDEEEEEERPRSRRREEEEEEEEEERPRPKRRRDEDEDEDEDDRPRKRRRDEDD